MEVILPVEVEITMVASVRRPETTALEDARTVIGCWEGVCKVVGLEGRGVIA